MSATAVGNRVAPLESSARGAMLDAGGVLALGSCSVLGFRTIFGGTGWIIVCAVGLLVGTAIGWLSAHRRFDALTTAVLTVVAYFLLSGVAIPDEALARVIPSPITVQRAATGAVRGWSEILTTLPPIGTAGGLLVVPLICTLVGATLAASAAFRTTGVLRPVLPLVGVSIASILFGIERPASLLVQGAMFATAATAWVAVRRRGTQNSAAATSGARRVIGGALMLTLGALVAVTLGDHLPGANANQRFILRDRSEPPFDPRTHPSPLAGFRHYKDDARGNLREQTIFKVSGMPAGVPLRLAVLDSYDGVVWTVAGSPGAGGASSGLFQRVGQTLPTDRSGTAVEVKVEVEAYDDIWLPDLGRVSEVRFDGPRASTLESSLRFNRATNTGAVPARLRSGDVVVIDAQVDPVPTFDDLSGRPVGSVSIGSATSISEEMKELAADLTDGKSPGYDRAAALASRLRDDLKFGYSDGRKDKDRESAPGHSAKRMQSFAVDAVDKGLTFGNAEQYASAHALMGRALGLPTRVVMGFCPKGCPGTAVEITGNDVSAWVEVNVDGYGWVSLSPTPQNDKQPETESPKPKPKPENAAQPPPPPVTTPPSEELNADDLNDSERPNKSNTPLISGTALALVLSIGSPILLVSGYVGLVVWLKRRRRNRRRGTGSKRDRVMGGWAQISDLAVDLGRPIPPVATRREAALLLGEEPAANAARMADLAVFGPEPPIDEDIAFYWDTVDATCDSMLSDLGPMARARVAVNPTSLVVGRRPAERSTDGAEPNGRRSIARPFPSRRREAAERR